MDVNRSESISPIAQREPRSDHQSKHHRDENDTSQDEAAHEDPWADEDAVDFDGSISGAVTPEVQAALEALASRLEPLRVDLERALEREATLRAQLDRHAYLPVLNRNGLEHEVARVGGRLSTHDDGLAPPPLFICVSVRNAPEIRRNHGRSAYDQVMTAACGILRKCFSEADTYGCLGGDDLGVIVFGTDRPGSLSSPDRVADRIVEAFASTSAEVNGSSMRLVVDVGVTSLRDNPTFSAALAAADANLMRRART